MTNWWLTYPQMIDETSRTIDLTDHSAHCVLALLRFIYAGVTQVPQPCLPGVLHLSHRFGLTLLSEVCQQQMDALSSPVMANDMETDELQLISTKPHNTSATSCTLNTDKTQSVKCSKTSDTSCSHDADKIRSVRNKPSASAPQTYVSHEDEGPPVLEKCDDPDSPPNIDFMEDIHYGNQAHNQNPTTSNLEDSLNVSVHRNKNSTEDVLQTEIKSLDDVSINSAERVVQSRSNCGDKVEKMSVATDDEEKRNTVVVIDVDNRTALADKQKHSPRAAQEKDAWSEPGSIGTVDIVSSVGPGCIPVTKQTGERDSFSSQSQANSAECAGIVQSSKTGTNSEKSDGGENQEQSQPSAINAQRDSLTQCNQQSAALSKQCDLVDSIEISDEDLFSSDDFDIASVSSSPTDCQSSLLHKSNHSVQKDTIKDTTPNSASISVACKNSIFSPPDAFCSPKNVQNGTNEKPVEKTERSVDRTSHERGRFTVDESPEGDRQLELGNNLSSTSMSTIEGSYQHSPSSAHPTHFQTSTPELSAPQRPTQRMISTRTPRQAYGSSSHDITVIPKSTTDETDATFPFSTDRIDETCSRDLDRDGVNRSNSGHQTPGVSVVLQDSLYITPVEQTNTRTTFQLVTPLLKPTAASLPITPVSRHPPQASSVLCSDSFVSKSNQTIVEGAVNEDPNIKECSETQDPHHDTDTKIMDDSDSDLEIIESSLQDAPSPKFSLQSRLGSSQPLSQTTPKPSQCLSQTTSRSSPTQSHTTKLSHTQTHPTPKPSQSHTAPRPSHSQSHITPSSKESVGQAIPKSATYSRQEKQFKIYAQQSKNIAQTHSPGRTQSHSPSLHHCIVRDHSPARGSPTGSQSRFSQMSADSDKDLLRVTDLVCGQEENDQRATVPEPDGKEDGAVCDMEKSIVDEDVWEDFNNMDDYNPDFFFGVLDPNSENDASPDKTSPHSSPPREPPCSPHNIATSPFPSPLNATPDPPLFKTPTKSPKRLKDVSPKESCVQSVSFSQKGQTSSHKQYASSRLDKNYTSVKLKSSDNSRQNSPQMKTARSKTSIKQATLVKVKSSGVNKIVTSSKESVAKPFKKQTTPVKVRPSGLDKTPTSTRESKREKAKSSDLKECLPQNAETGAGFFVVDEDTEAANSSFLWSEENAPTEESDLMSAALDLGREETVSSHLGSQRPSSKTPTMTKAGRKGGKSRGVPPSPFTPMPAYDNMTTPNLKTEVQKYGLKPVGKKRMKMVLKDIYHKTHQYETDSDCEDDMHLPNLDPPVLTIEADTGTHPLHTQPPPVLHKQSQRPRPKPVQKQSKKVKSTNAAQGGIAVGELGPDVAKDPPGLLEVNDASKPVKRPKTKRGLAQKSKETDKAEGMEKSGKTATGQPPAKKESDQSTKPTSLSPYKATQGGGRGKQKKAHVTSDTHSVPDSSSPEKSFSSQDSNASELPDVSVFEEGRLDFEDSEDITPSQQLASADLPERLMVFFQSHPIFYHKILTYEPLDLGVVREDLKASGLKCSQQKLLDFLDEKCITFTTKNMVTRKQRRRGKKSPVKKPRNLSK